MKIFHRYVLKLFIKYLIIVQLFVTIMSLFSSAMGDSKMLADYNYPFLQFVKLQLCGIVLNFNLVMPITTTVATIIVILLLMRSHELLAYVSLGGMILSLAIPFISVGIAISAGMIAIEYKVIPPIRDTREALISKMRGQKHAKRYGYTDLWLVDGENKLINIEVVNTADRELNGLSEYFLDKNGQIKNIETVETVKYSNNGWLAQGRKIVDISMNPPTVSNLPDGNINNKLLEDLFKVTATDIRGLSPTDLATMTKVLKSRGINVRKYENVLYAKYANALSVIVLLILTFPIAINFSRNYSLIKNAAVTFAMGLTYWLFQATCASLGKTVLSPILSNFLPLILFFIISIFFVLRRERAR